MLIWIPREPDVFGQPTTPTASSAAWATIATSRICAHSMPGTGSRSTRSSSGWSMSSALTGWGLRSMQPRFTIHAKPAASSTTISSAVRPGEGVPDKIQLRHPGLVEEHLARVRDRDLTIVDPQDLGLGFHGRRRYPLDIADPNRDDRRSQRSEP